MSVYHTWTHAQFLEGSYPDSTGQRCHPDEYIAIARYFTEELGVDMFDECSYRPHQLMYWPTTPSNGEYVFKYLEGE